MSPRGRPRKDPVPCSIEGCDRNSRCRGWCMKHYQTWRRHGDPTATSFTYGLTGDDDPRHGTVNGYTNLRCRCERCKAAWRVEHLDYMERHREQREKARIRERARTIRKRLAEVYTPEGCAIWLDSPNALLDGRAPSALIAEGNTRRVLDLIHAMAEGVTS